MSKYIDTFADAAVSSSSMTDTMTAPQAAVGMKKKVKIDASLLENLGVTTALLTKPKFSSAGETAECPNKQTDAPTCPQTCETPNEESVALQTCAPTCPNTCNNCVSGGGAC